MIRQREQVNSTKSATCGTNSALVVPFESNVDESTQDTRSSCSKVMDIIMQDNQKTASPYHHQHSTRHKTAEVIMQRLLDQFCSSNDIGLPLIQERCKELHNCSENIHNKQIWHLTNAMFPFLSMNQTFSIELMVMPKKFSSDPNYGVIIGEESMRLLNLDTSVQDNMILGVKNKSQWSLMTTGQQNASSSTNPG